MIPGFLQVAREIDGRTIVAPRALEILYQVCVSVKDEPGSVAECGVYRGGTLRLMARALPSKTVYGFDTFSGMPKQMVRSFDKYKEGEFGDTSLGEVAKFMEGLDNVCLVPGVFPDTFEEVPPDERFSVVHLDCDQYDSYLAALAFFLPRLTDTAYLVIDDYVHCEGAKRAIDQIFPRIDKPPYVLLKDQEGFMTLTKRVF